LLACFGPLISPFNPNDVNILGAYAPPSASHLLGTDASGRDLLTRLMVGMRTALVGPIIVVGIASVVSVALSLVAAWFGGFVDTVIVRVLDILLAFPGLIIAIIATAVFGASLTTAAIALSISYIPFIARVLRSEAIRERKKAYVEAAWLQGVTSLGISVRNILPNVTPVLISQVVLSLSYAIIDLAALSYLGLSVQPPTADLGTMVSTGQPGVLQGYPAETLSASICIVAIVLSLNVLGNRLSDWAENR
jgi:peptide/nickel transport system permease protein